MLMCSSKTAASRSAVVPNLARAVLARHRQAVRTMAGYRGEAGGVIRQGIPSMT
jgi:hypothetical protein